MIIILTYKFINIIHKITYISINLRNEYKIFLKNITLLKLYVL